MGFSVGDRVRVKPSQCVHFIQPWRGRFERGREGTILRGPSANVSGWLVEWDHRGRAKYPSDWRLVMAPGDLEHAQEQTPNES